MASSLFSFQRSSFRQLFARNENLNYIIRPSLVKHFFRCAFFLASHSQERTIVYLISRCESNTKSHRSQKTDLSTPILSLDWETEMEPEGIILFRFLGLLKRATVYLVSIHSQNEATYTPPAFACQIVFSAKIRIL